MGSTFTVVSVVAVVPVGNSVRRVVGGKIVVVAALWHLSRSSFRFELIAAKKKCKAKDKQKIVYYFIT